MKPLLRLPVALLALGSMSLHAAQNIPAPATPPAPPPSATAPVPPPPPPEARQFDFWLGDWEVFDQQGNAGGQSRIEIIAEGNGLLENWKDASGTTGKSLNVYNPVSHRWQQFWVGNGTPVLELSGGLVKGSMVLTGDRSGKGGAKVIDRIIWTPNPDGSVRQHWEISPDGGQTWREHFDGIYRRKK